MSMKDPTSPDQSCSARSSPRVLDNHACRASSPRVAPVLGTPITSTSGKFPWWGRYIQFHRIPSSTQECFPHYSQSTRRTYSSVGVIWEFPRSRPFSFIQQGWWPTSSCKVSIQMHKDFSGLDTYDSPSESLIPVLCTNTLACVVFPRPLLDMPHDYFASRRVNYSGCDWIVNGACPTFPPACASPVSKAANCLTDCVKVP